jgi:transposase
MVRVAPQRRKVSFYGTLNLATGEEVVLRAEKMNAATTVMHLQQLLARWPAQPILLLWDHAPWHSGAALREFLAAHPQLEIMLLPVAAPDLNPQEHVWKATRRAISHNHVQRDLATLADRFEQHLKEHTFVSTLLDTFDYPRICARFK